VSELPAKPDSKSRGAFVTIQARRFLSALRAGVLLAAVAFLAGCISGVPVIIENRSDKPIEHVVVSGIGFKESVGTVAAGATETVTVRPRSETGVTVAFEVDGQRYSAQSAEDDTIENDDINRVEIRVDEDLTTTVIVTQR
jgi:hypothetical protein